MNPYYSDGAVELYLGDCREVLPGLLSPSDCILAMDPPYGIGYATNHAVRGTAASWVNTSIAGDESLSLRDWALAWGGGCPAAVFGSWKAPRPAGVRTVLVWDKGPASGMGDLSLPWKPSWEEIYILGDGWAGTRDEGVLKGFNVLTWESGASHRGGGRSHPNEKPVGLLRHIIAKAPSERVVVDPFAGSGPTLIAAKELGRRAVGVEVEERYCEIAAKRLAQETLFKPEPRRTVEQLTLTPGIEAAE